MNHCIKRLQNLILLAIVVIISAVGTSTLSAQSAAGHKFTVTIDAGHGGRDPGARGKKSSEKDIALSIALKVGHYIESLMEDVNVYYTRKTDVLIPLYERGKIANRNNSDLFISIHVNANTKSSPTGTSTYVMGFSKSKENLDLVMLENKAILLEQDYQQNYDGFDNSPEKYIIFNNVQNNNLAQSLEIASAVQDQLRTRAQRKDIGVHQGNLVVLWNCTSPSVLIETGFISNPTEEAFLMTDNGQDIIASAIYMAVRQYKESVDAKVAELAKTSTSVGQNKETATTLKEAEVKPKETVAKAVVPEKTTEAKTRENEPEKAKETEKKVVEEAPVVKKSDAGVTAADAQTGIEYRVQILASQKRLPLNARDFKGTKDLTEFRIDNYYKYMSAPVKDYQEALELRRKLGATFRGAFIVAFNNGERVPLNTITDQRKN